MSRKSAKTTAPMPRPNQAAGKATVRPAANPGKAPSTFDVSRWTTLLAAGLIVVAVLVAYCNSYHAPFVFDAETSILQNPTIRSLSPIWKTFCPPSTDGETVSGRPLLNFSFAVNYAISGLDVWSYHAANVAIHILGSLLLLLIVRRTFLLPRLRDRWGAVATPLAFAIALLWAVHPLQTESVTYIVQRAESLVGLFYLLTLYCVIRGATLPYKVIRPRESVDVASHLPNEGRQAVSAHRASQGLAWWWYGAAVVSCVLGMASKEVMGSAPVIILLYDRAFLAGSFRQAWRRRWGLYVALATTWILLGWLVVSTSNRGGSAGLGAEMSKWVYLCTQFGAVVHYLRLSIWPHPLVLDYGTPTAHGAMQIVPYAIVIGLLALATLVALWRWPKVGFLGAWFFAILGPTSSIVPVITQTMAEHRMYVPLAAVVAGIVVGGYALGQWLVGRGALSQRAFHVFGGCLVVVVAVAFVDITFQRNNDYRTTLSIWEDIVAKVPYSYRAHGDYALELIDVGRLDDAIAQCREALKLKPDFAEAYSNIGKVFMTLKRRDEAIGQYEEALKINPNLGLAHYNLGVALAEQGKLDDAVAHFNKALESKPNLAEAHNSLANALATPKLNRRDEAIAHYRMALAIKPEYLAAYNNLGSLLSERGQTNEAIAMYQKALAVDPHYALAHCNLGGALLTSGRADEAIAEYSMAIAINPNFAQAYFNLGNALVGQGRFREAIAQYRNALNVSPGWIVAYNQLARLLATCRDPSVRNGAEAVALAQQAARLGGGREPVILDTLAAAYAEEGRFPEAIQTARQALDLAVQQNQTTVAEAIKKNLRLYEAGMPARAQ